jgi:hypoxanthine-DNA glycosylase
VIAALTGDPVPAALIDARRTLVLRHGIALWDSIESCEIEGSSDASIRNIVPVDIAQITDHCSIRIIAANGATAHKYYEKYLHGITGMEAVRLPSTSPANAAWSLDRLITAWGDALGEYL